MDPFVEQLKHLCAQIDLPGCIDFVRKARARVLVGTREAVVPAG